MGTEEGLTALLGPSLTLPCGSPQASPQRSALEPLSSSAVGGVWAGLPFPAGSCWQPQPSAWRPRPLPAAIPALNLWGSVSLCACCVAVMQRSTKAVREPQRQWAQRDSVPTFPAASRHQMPSRTRSVSCAGVQVGEEGPYLGVAWPQGWDSTVSPSPHNAPALCLYGACVGSRLPGHRGP